MADKVIREFDKCVWCGSTEMLGKYILDVAKSKGQVNLDFDWHLSVTTFNPPIDPRHPPLIGSFYSAALVYNDICLGCGKPTPVKIIETSVQIVNPVPSVPPTRNA